MKELEQESIVVEDKDTYRGLLMLGSQLRIEHSRLSRELPSITIL